MRFLANENFPMPAIRALREAGYVVDSIVEDTPGISDREVIQLANNKIILTFDKDYGELIFRYGASNPPAVVFFRAKTGFPVESANWLRAIIEQQKLQLENHFTVIDENVVRQRKY